MAHRAAAVTEWPDILRAERIKVAGIPTVMVTISPLLADIIRRLAEGRVQLDVVAMLETRESLLERLRSLAPALILIGLDPEEDDAIATTLAGLLAGVRVFAFGHDARHVSLNEAGKPARAFADPSAGELIAALGEGLDPAASRI